MANAVLDGTDAVMLSEEMAIGRFPVDAVTMMAAIAADAESSFPFDAWLHPFETGGPLPAAVGRAACTLAADMLRRSSPARSQAGPRDGSPSIDPGRRSSRRRRTPKPITG